ncbi:hypothetical protein [Halobacteriovorax sp. HLS]|uniref:hypothetical protein n=1 Tax=Halobacteriovorax sp. HLS TaxID=2234000 RepID=UPI000FD90A2A|nr:hypothetical protein [Halobacteriovorax sp. HLS]
MKWILLILSTNTFAGFSSIESSYDYKFEDRVSQKRSAPKRIRNKSSNVDQLLKKIEDSDKAISSILESNKKRVIVRRGSDSLKALSRIRGTLLNSVLATNKKTTTLVIKMSENEFFDQAEIRCHGLSFGKRVQGKCDLLVTDEKEYQVNAELWDLDGAEGIIADQFYSGEEKEFLTSSFTSFFEGVLSATKDRLVTPYGEVDRKSGKNQVLSGLIGVASNANGKIKESADKNLQIALINSGKEIYIFFQRSVKL